MFKGSKVTYQSQILIVLVLELLISLTTWSWQYALNKVWQSNSPFTQTHGSITLPNRTCSHTIWHCSVGRIVRACGMSNYLNRSKISVKRKLLNSKQNVYQLDQAQLPRDNCFLTKSIILCLSDNYYILPVYLIIITYPKKISSHIQHT